MTLFERLRQHARFYPPATFLLGVLATLYVWQINKADHANVLWSRFINETDRIASRMSEDVRDLTTLGLAALAAMGGTAMVEASAIAEALSYRSFDQPPQGL